MDKTVKLIQWGSERSLVEIIDWTGRKRIMNVTNEYFMYLDELGCVVDEF